MGVVLSEPLLERGAPVLFVLTTPLQVALLGVLGDEGVFALVTQTAAVAAVDSASRERAERGLKAVKTVGQVVLRGAVRVGEKLCRLALLFELFLELLGASLDHRGEHEGLRHVPDRAGLTAARVGGLFGRSIKQGFPIRIFLRHG